MKEWLNSQFNLLSQIVKEKIISWSKKEMKNFIGAKFGDYNPGRTSQKTPRTVLSIRNQGTVM